MPDTKRKTLSAQAPRRFVDEPGRYWELEIEADTAGRDFKALFLLPVSARPHD